MSEPFARGTPDSHAGLPSGLPFGPPLGRGLHAIAEGLAVFGGLILLVITFFTVISVAGRTGFDLPILGDQEIVEFGIAIAIFSFMPYCQMRAANVIVDFFTARTSRRTRHLLDVTMNAIFSVCIGLITWRLAVGGMAAFHNGDTSMFLRIPLWWGYLVAVVCSLLWMAACLYSVARSWSGMGVPALDR